MAKFSLFWAGFASLAAMPLHAGESWLARSDYQLHSRITLQEVVEDASGLSFDPISRRLWLVTDNARLHELSSKGEWLRSIPLQGFTDPEGIAWLGTEKGVTRLAISEERRGLILDISIKPNVSSLDFKDAHVLARFDKQGSNHGIEGLAWDDKGQRLFAVNEENPQAVYLIRNNAIRESWRVSWRNFWREPLDYAGIAFTADTGTLLIVSDRSRELREYSLEGKQLARLSLDARDPEGIAVAPDGTLYICSEPNLLLIYKPKGQSD